MNIKFNVLVLSDIHLGHPTNAAVDIIANLDKFMIGYNKYIKHVNMIILAGDVYDRLLTNGGSTNKAIIRWLIKLALYCKKNNIKLRILEGTPSHDWKQCSTLDVVLKDLNIDIDFKYIDSVYIEHLVDEDIDILYVPDEVNHKASTTLKEVKNLMNEKNLDTVHLAVMHGQFPFQLPNIKLESSHDENAYSELVSGYIVIGHIHKHNYSGKIIAQGSFDRLVHGEEEDKGGVIITLNKYGDSSWIFLKNKYAKIYNTYDYTNENAEVVKERLDEDLKGLRPGSMVRLLVAKNSGLIKHKKEISELYPNLTIKIETKNENDKYTDIAKPIKFEMLDSFSITKDNIVDLMSNEINTKYDLLLSDMNLFKKEMSLVV